MQETKEMQVQSLSWEDTLEKEMAIHSSILAWTMPWTEEPGRLQSIGLQRVRHNWSDLAGMHTKIYYYKKDIIYVIDIIYKREKNPAG